jgi:hypothetical protein
VVERLDLTTFDPGPRYGRRQADERSSGKLRAFATRDLGLPK